ncbi:MAG: 3-dehydroquinate synthase [Verrucomicrobiae bacterium]|nr:3-dehydroquinate synthase [Verrucomicrobiae bacterium]
MSVIERHIQVSWPLRVFFTENVFEPDNLILRNALTDAAPRKVLVVLEDSLAQALPGLEVGIENYFAAHAKTARLVRPPLYVCGSESAKNSPTIITELQSHISRNHIDRHSYLIAVGGGALLDVAGFAAAIAHRGVRHVRIPTTTLSQADSGVGVKNGLNAFGKKNFIGTFAPPYAVINDFNLLATLEPRDKRGGYAEAVKVACIRDAKFFEALERDAARLAAFEPAAMKQLIRRCAELHLEHIATGGDPFERGSARPLDFGHWAAHKLEQLSRFRISHGEAVAIGIALDVIYARNIGLLSAASAERILKLLAQLGFRLFADELLNADDANRLTVLTGLEEFREHLGGELTITLLKEIGCGVEVHEMDAARIIAAIHELRDRK